MGLLLLLSLTLCNPIDGSPSGSSVHGILQSRILEWVAISFSNACMHAKSIQSCLTLCDPIDSSSPGPSIHGILQARILEWVAISFSEFVGLQKRKMTTFSTEMNYFKRTQRFLLYCLSGMRTTLFSQAPVCFIFFILQIIFDKNQMYLKSVYICHVIYFKKVNIVGL